ncbi:hypothetical protein LX32DRAFT_147157 [Colletotrichum zoysiae]|uniref:Uncharacterized protein n=1 Tax=Colletotrichum zoysiae TaxID=1216348 RepID=A0AAD9LZ39_9PEZI|nr:hypothetical protein LX32DRAFT_147157 [Colletotrichum zoysiae]
MFLALILPGPGVRPPSAGGLRGCHKANTGQTESTSIPPLNCQPEEPPSLPFSRGQKDFVFRVVMPGVARDRRSLKPTTTRPWQQTPLPRSAVVARPPLESHSFGSVFAFMIREGGGSSNTCTRLCLFVARVHACACQKPADRSRTLVGGFTSNDNNATNTCIPWSGPTLAQLPAGPFDGYIRSIGGGVWHRRARVGPLVRQPRGYHNPPFFCLVFNPVGKSMLAKANLSMRARTWPRSRGILSPCFHCGFNTRIWDPRFGVPVPWLTASFSCFFL